MSEKRRAGFARTALALAVVAMSARAAAAECRSDGDCEDDHACENGQCVTRPAPVPVKSCDPGKVVTEDSDGHCCFPKQVWSRSRDVCVGVPACSAGMVAVGEDCRPVVAGSTPPPPASAARRDGDPDRDREDRSQPGSRPPLRLAVAALAEGFLLRVGRGKTATSYTGVGGGGVGARGGIERTIGGKYALRGGVGFDFFFAADSPVRTRDTFALYFLQVPLYAGIDLRPGESLAIGLDWQPTIQVAVVNGNAAAAMNPFGVGLTFDVFVRDEPSIHPRLAGFFLAPVGDLPITGGGGLGISWF